MSQLPVSGKTYFIDFADSIVSYDIQRDGAIIASLGGIPNKESGRTYVHFQYGADIQPGDVLIGSGIRQIVSSVETDVFEGKPELLMAFVKPA